MEPVDEGNSDASALLAQLRAFAFPGGEEAARRVRVVHTTQRGEIRMSPAARWIPFTAEETIQTTGSGFRWTARLMGGMRFLRVIDEYAEGRGRLVIQAGGLVPIKTIRSADTDKAELQRYLAGVILCPPVLLNHPSLAWTPARPGTLRVRDQASGGDTSVEIDVGPGGCPTGCRALRPRLVGKDAVLTAWSAVATEFGEWEGIRAPRRLEVFWHLEDGPFAYFRAELTSFQMVC